MRKPQIWKVIGALIITCVYIFAVGVVGRVEIDAHNGSHAIEVSFPEASSANIQTPAVTTSKSVSTIDLGSLPKPSYGDKLPTSQTATHLSDEETDAPASEEIAPESTTLSSLSETNFVTRVPDINVPSSTAFSVTTPAPVQTTKTSTTTASTTPAPVQTTVATTGGGNNGSPTPTSPDDVAVYDREAQATFYCTKQELLNMATPTRLVVYDRTIGGYAIGNMLDIVTAATVGEISYIYSAEAVKANAVCEYTYIRKSNIRGEIADTNLHRDIYKEHVKEYIYSCVEPVIGKAIYYGNEMIQCVFTAATCGYTESSYDVWGVDYPYLVSVDSSWEMEYADDPYNNFIARPYTFSSSYIKDRVKSTLGINLTGDPTNWIKVVSTLENKKNGWVTEAQVGGKTTYVNSYGNTRTITGRTIRESVLGFSVPSPAFTVKYNKSSDEFTFYIYGSGHGVGFSQFGAHVLAKYKGWDYEKILKHYFKGAVVR